MGWYEHWIQVRILGKRSAHNSERDTIDLELWNEIHTIIKSLESNPRYASLSLNIEISESE